ncbi:MAG: DEAD/DEAH box helicase, partial [Promethearchaeota archaeon]
SVAHLRVFTKNNKKLQPQIKESFFILWLPLNLSEETLSKSIKKVLPDFPIEKSLSCKINLAYPWNFIQQENVSDIPFESEKMILGTTIAKIVPLKKILGMLTDFSLISVDAYTQLECSPSMYFWSLLTKLTIQLIAKGSFIPNITRVHSDEQNIDFFEEKIGTMQSEWSPILKTERDIQNYIRIQDYAPISAHNIPPPDKVKNVDSFSLPDELKCLEMEDSKLFITSHLYSVSNLSRNFIKTLLDSLIRESTSLVEHAESKLPWDLRVVKSLLSESKQFSIYDVKEEVIPKIFERWSQRLNLSWNLGYSLKLQLETPQSGEDQREWSLKFLLHSLSDDSIELSIKEFWREIQLTHRNNDTFQMSDLIPIREYCLKSFNILSGIFTPINTALKEKYPTEITLTTDNVINLLQTGIPAIKSYGYSIDIPETFSLGGSQRIQPVLTIESGDKLVNENMDSPIQFTSFDISSILTYEWVLKIGDTILSELEKTQLLETEESESLLYWNNKWIMVDKREITQFQGDNKHLKGSISGENALRLALTQNAYLKNSNSEASGPYPVQFYGPLEEILRIIQGKVEMPHLSQPPDFVGVLRKYQEYGFNWMNVLSSIGFGCVLADDMGLGKTIQVIALILTILQEKKQNMNFLVICPTSVLGNWMRELKKFAPTIRSELHYGVKRAKNIDGLTAVLKHNDIILTSYNIIRRDIELFEVVKWESVILDESQNIKNYKTKQAKAIYRLVEKTRRKIALSGTPIENRITELWSLYHFINPFLLGSRSQFMKKYAIPVGKLGNESLTHELRNLVNPFLLRRMKTNKEIVPELPDKQETEVYISLTDQQKEHYKSIVENMLKVVEALEENSEQKFKQKGMILTALMQLKQVCNHPDQFLHTSLDDVKQMEISDFIAKSGKLQRFIELLEEAIASRNKVLVFTQFKVMGDYIQYVIERQFNIHVPFIHGGVPQENRTRIVNQYQDDSSFETPILLLSLRAGGIGLNLSKASIVIHVDRWWNPAVEDQATDRAYRIGQENKVFVYKMVAEGTIEEKISKMLEEKRALVDKIIKVTGEEWITELSLGELKDIFQLEEGDL